MVVGLSPPRLCRRDLTVQAFHQNFAALFEGGTFASFRLSQDGSPFLDQSEIQSRKSGMKLTYSIPQNFLAGFTPRFGLDFFNDNSSQILARTGRQWVPETVLRSLAPFFQLEHKFGSRLTISGGLRLEAARVIVDDFTTIASAANTFVSGGNPSFSELLPNTGAVFELGGGLSVFASYSEGFTMPDVGRVLRDINTPGLDVDNLLNIKPVVTNNSEGGLRYRSGRVRAEASYYRSDSSLGALLVINPDGFFNVRRERTEIDGVEISGEVRPHDRLILGGNYAWLRGKFDSDGDDRTDTGLDGPNIAPNRVNLFAQFFPTSRVHGRLQVSKLFDRSFRGPAAPANADFNGYVTADLILGFSTRAGVVRLGVENLLDKQYLTYFAQTDPGQRNDTIFAGRGRTFTLIFEPRFGAR